MPRITISQAVEAFRSRLVREAEIRPDYTDTGGVMTAAPIGPTGPTGPSGRSGPVGDPGALGPGTDVNELPGSTFQPVAVNEHGITAQGPLGTIQPTYVVLDGLQQNAADWWISSPAVASSSPVIGSINLTDAARPLFDQNVDHPMPSFADVSFEMKSPRFAKSGKSDSASDPKKTIKELNDKLGAMNALMQEVLDDYQNIAQAGAEPFDIGKDDISIRMAKALEGAKIPVQAMSRPSVEMIARQMASNYNLNPDGTTDLPGNHGMRVWQLFRNEAMSIQRLIKAHTKEEEKPEPTWMAGSVHSILWGVFVRFDNRHIAAHSYSEAIELLDNLNGRFPELRAVIEAWPADATTHRFYLNDRVPTDSLLSDYAMRLQQGSRSRGLGF
ncbi:collagen-like protein [Methylobacterium ajmalii]|uniref:Collagen-like protein n=1 Tax=Methylobacterium ajmalii TaxID=2738439 RepID=A0ABV0A420_9HYPH